MIYGDTKRTECPVCLEQNFKNVWKIPMTKLDEVTVIHGARFNKLPFLNSETIYHFSKCNLCGTVFLDPFSSKYWDDRGDTYHKDKAISKREWESYTAKANLIASYIDPLDKTVVDMACGGGQVLSAMKENGQKWSEMVGIEINKAAAQYVNSLGFIGIQGDICKRLDINDQSVDCVIFSEAFEHVQSQYYVIEQISRILKPGGVLYMTAQALEADLPIRPEESVYVFKDALESLLKRFNLNCTDIELSAGRWKLIAHKI